MRIKTLINIILIGAFIICGFKSINILTDYKKASESTIVVQSMKSSGDNAFISKNEDFRFWIKINNTEIDYPVVQGVDNEFYLKHDFFKEESVAGSVFVDYRVNAESKNTILYGHNMKDGSMFSDVELFKNKEFFDNNRLITISKDNKDYIYEVFSVYYLSGAKTNHLKVNFDSEEDFLNYLTAVKENSLFSTEKELNSNDILTLSTCSYEGKNFRTVVYAQLIDVQ